MRCRLKSNLVRHLRALQGSRSKVDRATVDGLTLNESLSANCRHSVDVVRVHVVVVVNVGVIEDVRIIDDRVVHVDDGDEIMAATEPRKEWFAEAERDPADTEPNAATQESHKSRSIARRSIIRARAPAPAAREIVPAAIVVRSKAPRRVINPGPAPGADPISIAITVGSPTGRDFGGIPDMAVFRFISPRTVVIEIVVAGNITRNVPSGNGVVFLQVALGGPTIEAIWTGGLVNAVLNIVGAGEFAALSGVDFIGFAASGNFAFAADHGNASRVAVFIDVNAKSACLFDSKSKIWRVYFVEIALPQFADTEVQTAFREAHLRDALVKVQERKRGHTAKMHRGSASLQFGAGVFVHPNLVADGYRTVLGGAAPIALTAGLKGDRTIDVADARDARWRIFFIRSRLRRHKTQKTG